MSENNNNNQEQQQQQQKSQFPPLLIKAGLVFSESIPLSELFCKPKLLPIRGTALERLEELDEKIIEQRKIADEDKVVASKFGTSGGSDLAGSAQKSGGDYSGGSPSGGHHARSRASSGGAVLSRVASNAAGMLNNDSNDNNSNNQNANSEGSLGTASGGTSGGVAKRR